MVQNSFYLLILQCDPVLIPKVVIFPLCFLVVVQVIFWRIFSSRAPSRHAVWCSVWSSADKKCWVKMNGWTAWWWPRGAQITNFQPVCISVADSTLSNWLHKTVPFGQNTIRETYSKNQKTESKSEKIPVTCTSSWIR